MLSKKASDKDKSFSDKVKRVSDKEKGECMKIGEVCLATNDVVTLANFYKELLHIDNKSNDEVHQTLIADETQFTIYNDGIHKDNNNRNIVLAFTVDNIEEEYQKLLAMGVEMIEKPTKRPWGATNLSFYDPDKNIIYLRCLGEINDIR